MYGTPASEATLAIFSAMIRACTSLSITHGPAIKKRGLPPPRRSEPREISLPVAMRNFEDSTEAVGVAKGGRLWTGCKVEMRNFSPIGQAAILARRRSADG